MTPDFYERHPASGPFEEIFDFLREKGCSEDVSAIVAKSLLWAERKNGLRKSSDDSDVGNLGRFTQKYSVDDLTRVAKMAEAWTTGDLLMAVSRETGMCRRTFYRLLKDAKDSGEIVLKRYGLLGVMEP